MAIREMHDDAVTWPDVREHLRHFESGAVSAAARRANDSNDMPKGEGDDG